MLSFPPAYIANDEGSLLNTIQMMGAIGLLLPSPFWMSLSISDFRFQTSAWGGIESSRSPPPLSEVMKNQRRLTDGCPDGNQLKPNEPRTRQPTTNHERIFPQ
jgi:hypothetical protein